MPENEKPRRFVLLIRHASRERRWDHPESEHEMAGWSEGFRPGRSDFKAEGFERTYAMAGRLCDELRNEKIVVTKVIHSEHLVAQQTAKVYEKVLRERSEREKDEKYCLRSGLPPDPCPALTPEKFQLNEVTGKIKPSTTDGKDGEPTLACIVIGHQPHLTKIARELLKKGSRSGHALPGNSLPLDNSEVACIRLGDKPRLLWLLTAKPKELLGELKDKIKSKYDVAKFFLGAFVVNTGLILNAGIWGNVGLGNQSHLTPTLLAGVGVIAALSSLAFTAATLFSYDSLMMPERFWSETNALDDQQHGDARKPPGWSVLRPPSQAHVILFYEMMHVWNCFFMPAIGLAFLALVSVIFALVLQDVSVSPFDDWLNSSGIWRVLPIVFFLSSLLAFAIPAYLYWRKWGPRLGSED